MGTNTLVRLQRYAITALALAAGGCGGTKDAAGTAADEPPDTESYAGALTRLTPPEITCPAGQRAVLIRRGEIGDVSDADVSEKAGNWNNGRATELRTGQSAAAGSQMALIGFDLSPIPSGTTIASAALYLLGYTSAPATVYAFGLTAPAWTEREITWNRFAMAEGSLIDTMSFPAGTYSWQALPLGGEVQRWIDLPTTNNGLVLVQEAGKTTYKSSDHRTSSHRPFLGICYYVPACEHDLCETGERLSSGACGARVAAVCEDDPYCCETAWDELCVAAVESAAGSSCR